LSYIGQRPVVGRYIKLDQISSGFNGSETSFSMTAGSQAVFPGTARNLLLSLGGVIQEPDTNFTISGSTLTFTTAPVANTTFFAVIFGDMQSTGTPSDGTVLPASIASSGNFSFPQLTVTGTSSLGDDVTLTGANYNVLWDKSDNALEFADSAKATFGTGADLLIYHDGTSNIITSVNGNFFLQAASGENGITINQNGAVELYYDNSKKFETTSAGISVTGSSTFGGSLIMGADNSYDIGSGAARVRNMFMYQTLDFLDTGKIQMGNLDDLQIYHDGSNSYLDNSTGDFFIRNNSNAIKIRPKNDEESIVAHENGAVELHYDNSKKFETTSEGVRVPVDSGKVSVGSTGNLFMYHTGTSGSAHGLLDNSYGIMYHLSPNFEFRQKGTNDTLMKLNGGANVELYYDNSKKFETASHGVEVIGKLTFAGDGHTQGIELGADADIVFYHDNSDGYLDNNVGDLYLRNDGNSTSEKVRIQAKGGEQSIICSPNGAVELYYDNSLRFETTSGGAQVTGSFNITGELNLTQNGAKFFDVDTLTNSNSFTIRHRSDANAFETAAVFVANGAASFTHNGTTRLATTSDGVDIVNVAQIGTSNDQGELRIGHDGTSYRARLVSNSSNSLEIDADGPERIQMHGGVIYMRPLNSEKSAAFVANGAAELYYDDSKKLETTSTGFKTESSSDVVFRITKTASSDAEIKNTGSLDLCCSSGGAGGQIIRFLTGANPSSLVEHMQINGGGHVLFNQSTTHVPGLANTTVGASMEDVGAQGSALFISRGDSISLFLNRNNTGQMVSFRQSGTEVGSISTNSHSLPSDRNFKKNITDLTLGLDFVNTLKPSKYNLKLEEDTDPLQFGLIAQDVEEALTAAGVSKNSIALCQHNPKEDEAESDYNLDYGKFVPILINAIKELSTKVAALEAA